MLDVSGSDMGGIANGRPRLKTPFEEWKWAEVVGNSDTE